METMMTKKFKRTKEDFSCEKCGFDVKGNGYTNHCPRCLWSRHVDVNPGDRRAACRGLMEPIGIELKGKEFIVIHRCARCGFEKKNKTSKNDCFDAILRLSSRPIK